MAISSEWAGLRVSPTLPYLRVSKVCLMPPGNTWSYKGYSGQPRIYDKKCHTQTHPQLETGAPLTARSISLRCVSAAEHQTEEQHSKTGRTKPRKHLTRSDISWNTPALPQDIKSLRSCSGNRFSDLAETEPKPFSRVFIFSLLVPTEVQKVKWVVNWKMRLRDDVTYR